MAAAGRQQSSPLLGPTGPGRTGASPSIRDTMTQRWTDWPQCPASKHQQDSQAKKKKKKVTRFAFSRWPPSMSDQPTKVATQTPLCSSRFHQKTNTWMNRMMLFNTGQCIDVYDIKSGSVGVQWTIHNITVQTFRLIQPSKGWEQKEKKKATGKIWGIKLKSWIFDQNFHNK